MQAIEVGLAKAPLGHFEEAGILQFFEVGSHTAFPCSHVVRELLLAGKAGVIRPGVFQKHGIGELGADTELLIGEDEVRDLGEAMERDGISTDDLDVASDLLKPAVDGIHARFFQV